MHFWNIHTYTPQESASESKKALVSFMHFWCGFGISTHTPHKSLHQRAPIHSGARKYFWWCGSGMTTRTRQESAICRCFEREARKVLSTYELQTAQNKCMAQLAALLTCQRGSKLKVPPHPQPHPPSHDTCIHASSIFYQTDSLFRACWAVV
jgi:hypothetical protein